ncbi:tannase/feruloyl esterase family alpha/beta hydrolase [Streptomyces sp. NPDC001595]|uniref:tannase/feruloyl esterase family alpha/beta hydrolase n=1 Tax=Streptomyces sp. NPDC001532 TaxID=3154520 RepID=UPI0033340F98
MRRFLATAGLAGTLIAGMCAPVAHAEPVTVSCTGLVGLAIPAAAIGLPTTGGEVTAAQQVPASGQGTAATGAYCRVDAVVRPVDPTAPDIRLRVALPVLWNGGAMMLGGGGYDGTVPDVAGNVPFGPVDRPTPLARGYAVFAGDSGHQAAPDHQPTPSLDGSFGGNDEALRNFAGNALKKTRDAARYVLRAHYGTSPARSYFAGGSTGGREALAVAQRWPADFDGVIAVYPAWNAASLDLFFGYEAQVLAQPGAFPGPAQQELLHRSVIEACDGDDGLRDGVISDEAGCRFDPRTLRCPDEADEAEETADTAGRGGVGGTSTTGATAVCLTDRQIDAVKALSTPLRWKYELASGETGYPGFPFLSGADMTTPLLGMGSQAPADPMPRTSGYGVQFWDQWVKYFVTRDPARGALTVDPLAPGRWQRRISELSALQDVNDPDLSRFARAGGKLLVLHGTADELVSHRSTVEYFRRVQRVMGKRATQEFARLYLVPGANHANIGTPFAASWDSLTALEDWTRTGEAPRNPVVTDRNPGAGLRTRPLCAYPAWPRYTGTGDPGAASSFRCRTGGGR